MLDEIIKTALSTILSWGGGWVLSVLLIIAIIFMDKRIKELHAKCDEQRSAGETAVSEQFEKRLEEFKTILGGLERSTSALNSMQIAVDNRTEIINQLVSGFANLVRDLENNRERWRERGDAWTTQLADLKARVEKLQAKAGVLV